MSDKEIIVPEAVAFGPEKYFNDPAGYLEDYRAMLAEFLGPVIRREVEERCPDLLQKLPTGEFSGSDLTEEVVRRLAETATESPAAYARQFRHSSRPRMDGDGFRF